LSYIFQSEDEEGLADLKEQVDNLALDVTQMEGVSNVTVKGYDEQTDNIDIDRETLEENQMTPDEIIQEIDQSFNPVVLETETKSTENIRIRLQNMSSVEIFENIRVSENDTQLTDIADIGLAVDEQEDII